jgi:hypothetical protein
MPASVNSGYVILAAAAVELVLDDVEQPAMHPVGQGQGFEVKLPDLIRTQLAWHPPAQHGFGACLRRMDCLGLVRGRGGDQLNFCDS